MSLNRTEQQVLDYVQRNPEERHYWEQKVRALAAEHPDVHAAAAAIDAGLRRYLEERAQVVKEFREYAGAGQSGNARRLSLRGLAEYWLRMWAPPRPKKAGGAGSGV